jgi:hypothetical protein
MGKNSSLKLQDLRLSAKVSAAKNTPPNSIESAFELYQQAKIPHEIPVVSVMGAIDCDRTRSGLLSCGHLSFGSDDYSCS